MTRPLSLLVLACALLLVQLVLPVQPAQAQSLASALVPTNTDDLAQRLAVRFPGTAGAKIEPAFPGFFSVVKEGQVIFVNADLSLMINGDVVDLASGQSLTNRIRQANRPVVNIQKLDTKDAIAIGTGARKLYVFSDPDCPYCQSLEKELEKLKDVTVYVFLFPLTSLHPQAATIAESVWCSKNKAAAWRAYLLNKELPPSANLSGQGLQVGWNTIPRHLFNATR
jgi:protein-disulfide isomerase